MNFEYFFSLMQDHYFSLCISLFAICVKGYVLAYLYNGEHTHSQKTTYLRGILSVGLLCSISVDSAWVVVLLNRLSLIAFAPLLIWNWIRFSWLCSFVYGQTTALFLQYITQKEAKLNIRHYLHFIPSIMVFCFYVVYAIFHYKNDYVDLFEQRLWLVGIMFTIFFLILPSIFYTERSIRSSNFPRILGLQVRLTMLAFIAPLIAEELIGILANNGIVEKNTHAAFSAVTTLFLSVGIYVIGKRIRQLRFLNLQSKVTSAPRATFATEMKNISNELNSTTSPHELHHIIRLFFKDAFSIPIKRTHFYLHDDKNNLNLEPNSPNRHSIIESFLTKKKQVITEQLKQHEILIMDELVFSNFYNHDPVQEKFINLLELINADLLLPIFKRDRVVAYIVVDRYARHSQLYSNVESDEMVVFATCIGNLVNILQNKNLEVVAHREKTIRQQLHSNQRDLEEELYHKHQENNQYKESLRSFLRNSQQREIGILFYKNRKFSFANRAAQNIIDLDLNGCPGHPLVKSITRIARDVEEFKTAQSCIIKNSKGKRIVLSAVPSLEKNSVIITTHPPEISDLIKKQIDLLKEPRNWDYLLYLETTKSGRLINELIPGTSESILNFKIELLKIALGKQTILINAPSDDIIPMIEILHQISLRDTLHIIKLHEQSTSSHTAIKIFGANKLLYPKDVGQPPLLEKLDKVGTLLIENVQYLTLDAQKQLAEYILYGYFNPVHSEEKIVSDVRIICSSNYNLKKMSEEGLFDVRLYKALQKTSVEMPSLINLDSDEFKELTESIASQSIKENELENLMGLSEKEKNAITNERPTSLVQLQHKIKTILTRKSKNSHISYDSNFDEASTTDPVITQALQLGKKALRNEKIMVALWNKFKNQTKIATLLGVNRSSVNRRCREYNLI